MLASLVASEGIAIGFLTGISSRAVSIALSLTTVRLQSEHEDLHQSSASEKFRDVDDHSSYLISNVVR